MRAAAGAGRAPAMGHLRGTPRSRGGGSGGPGPGKGGAMTFGYARTLEAVRGVAGPLRLQRGSDGSGFRWVSRGRGVDGGEGWGVGSAGGVRAGGGGRRGGAEGFTRGRERRICRRWRAWGRGPTAPP